MKLPDGLQLHDWRASKITNGLDHHENPVEVSANGHVVGHATAQKSRRPHVKWGPSWCPRGDLNPHAR